MIEEKPKEENDQSKSKVKLENGDADGVKPEQKEEDQDMKGDDLENKIDELFDYKESKPVVKFDYDSESVITFNTDTSSFMRNPSTINTVASSKLELQLNFLAKQLELER